jgi:geranylgeranyl pyrophosphate synthase
MTSATSDARPRKQHRALTDLTRRHPGVMSQASDRVTVDRPSLMAPSDQLTLDADRLHEILITGGAFDAIYRHILAAPGKRVRAGLVLACARLLPSAVAVPLRDAVDAACAVETFHEASLVHDYVCDGSLLRRDAPSVPAAFGVRTAARARFCMAGKALQVVARVLADNPAVFARLGGARRHLAGSNSVETA